MCLAVPGQVLAVHDDELRTATVRFGAVTRPVSLAMVPDAQPGDFVIVHVGFAISKLDEEAAHRSLEAIASLFPDEQGVNRESVFVHRKRTAQEGGS